MSPLETTAAHRAVTELFLRALDLDGPAQEAWLADLAAEQPDHAAAVRQWLASHAQAGAFLAIDEAGVEAAPAARAGQSVGPFTIEREIGEGGMGTVYLARREGAGFSQRVALKLLGPHGGGAAAERLRDERRILAALNHPHIAYFVDGGATAEGLPFIAMEYVEGRPITEHAVAAGLDVPARLRLFLRVCAAVHFAHQHLVVHRDIKPSNILVTADGTPKLLDFGIAKLLDDRDARPAGTVRVLTPHYASPEQVRGETVTTATDVYSLGVLLFELLTGHGPYRGVGRDSSTAAVMDAIRHDEPERLATHADRSSPVSPDLEAIVGKTLRKDPRDRYGSAEQLALDLTRYLDGLPVEARPESGVDRLQRVARRHWAGVTAAAIVVVALAAAMAVSLWQARLAQAERDKAQRRFRQVEEFSRSLLFDVHGALRDVPGATEARRLLLDRAVAFLDGLVADAGRDPDLMRALAAGYEQLANVQGNGLTQNVGDTAGALASLDKAAGYIDALRERDPANVDLLTLAIDIHFGRTWVLQSLEDPRMASERAVHAALVGELERRHLDAAGAVAAVAKGHNGVGRFLADSGDFAAAEQAYRRSVDLYATLPAAERTEQSIAGEASALKRLGAVLLRRQALDESEQRYLAALRLDEESIRLHDRPQTRFDMTFTLSDLALVRSLMNRWADAEVMWRRALAIREAAWAADPKDTRALAGVGVLYGRLGLAAHTRHDWPAAIVAYRAEVARRQDLLTLAGRMPARVADLSWARLRLAETLLDLASDTRRAEQRRACIDEARQLVAATNGDDGKPSVAAGSEPGFVELRDTLVRTLAATSLRAAAP